MNETEYQAGKLFFIFLRDNILIHSKLI